MTVAKNECIRAFEEHFNGPVSVDHLLYCNELPLRCIFTELDDIINSPNSFCGMIEKLLENVVSE